MTGNHGTAKLKTQGFDDLSPYWKPSQKLLLNGFSEAEESVDEETMGGYSYPSGVPGFILGENEWLTEGEREGQVIDELGVVWNPSVRPGMALTVGGSRKGKGASTLIPALLGYSGSCIAIDIKGELAWITAPRRRQLGQRVVILDPFNEVNESFGALAGEMETVTRYNPLADLDPNARSFAEDVAGVVEALVWQHDKADPFFTNSARDLVTGLIAAIVQSDPGIGSLPDVRDWLNLAEDELASRCQQFCELETSQNTLAHRKLQAYGTVTKTYSSVIATCKEQLSFLDSDEMRSFLQTDPSPFRFSELTSVPTTVYIVLPFIHLENHARFLRLCVSQGIRTVTQKRAKLASPVVFFLDEMGSSLGPMPIVQKAWGAASGLGLVLWGFIQNIGQLKNDYPKAWETFTANSAMIQMIACRDLESSKYFSEYLGNETVETIQRSQSHTHNEGFTSGTNEGTSGSSGTSYSSGGAGSSSGTNSSSGSSKGSSSGKSWGWSDTSGTNTGEMGRPLLDPEQVRTLADDRGLVIFPGETPYNLPRLFYFSDSRFFGMYRPDPHYHLPDPSYRNPPKQRNPVLVAEEEAERQRRLLADWKVKEAAQLAEQYRLQAEKKEREAEQARAKKLAEKARRKAAIRKAMIQASITATCFFAVIFFAAFIVSALPSDDQRLRKAYIEETKWPALAPNLANGIRVYQASRSQKSWAPGGYTPGYDFDFKAQSIKTLGINSTEVEGIEHDWNLRMINSRGEKVVAQDEWLFVNFTLQQSSKGWQVIEAQYDIKPAISKDRLMLSLYKKHHPFWE